MKDKIEEIINDLQRISDRKCYPEDILDGSIAQEWVDHITDLKEENKKLNNILNNQFADICKKEMIDKLSATEMIIVQDREIKRLNNIIDKFKGLKEGK